MPKPGRFGQPGGHSEGPNTRSHPELGRENPQRRWYCRSSGGRAGRRQARQTPNPINPNPDRRQTRRARRPAGRTTPPVPGSTPRTIRGPPHTKPTAGWSSPVARQAHNLKVAGSNPAPATKPQTPPQATKPPRKVAGRGHGDRRDPPGALPRASPTPNSPPTSRHRRPIMPIAGRQWPINPRVSLWRPGTSEAPSLPMLRIPALIAVLAALVGLAGCASYRPRPLSRGADLAPSLAALDAAFPIAAGNRSRRIAAKTAANPVAAHRHPDPHPNGAQRPNPATLFQHPARKRRIEALKARMDAPG